MAENGGGDRNTSTTESSSSEGKGQQRSGETSASSEGKATDESSLPQASPNVSAKISSTRKTQEKHQANEEDRESPALVIEESISPSAPPSTPTPTPTTAVVSINTKNDTNNSTEIGSDSDDDDGPSQAARALAAVAAAATANNTSPSAAAEAARALAPGIAPEAAVSAFSGEGGNKNDGSNPSSVPSNNIPPLSPRPRPIIPVDLKEVKDDMCTRLEKVIESSEMEDIKIQDIPLTPPPELQPPAISDDEIQRQKSRRNEITNATATIEPPGESQPQTSVSLVSQLLADGENDSLLQLLLILANYRGIESTESTSGDNSGSSGEETPSSPATAIDLTADGEGPTTSDEHGEHDNVISAPVIMTGRSKTDNENRQAWAASERVLTILNMAENSYDAMLELLPKVDKENQHKQEDGQQQMTSDVVQTVIADLLPPCYSSPGDATIQFFWACLGRPTSDIKGEKALPEKKTQQQQLQRDSNPSSSFSHSQGSTATQESSSGITTASSVFSSVMSSVKRSTSRMQSPTRQGSSGTFANVFGRMKSRQQIFEKSADQSSSTRRSKLDDRISPSSSPSPSSGDYTVVIDREMLGLTVENVLERTVVRTVLAGGAAKRAGAKVGSLIVKVGSVETKNLTHFETIDELRRSNRPLELVLRQISSESLRMAREEMGRLVRGGSFGVFNHQHSLIQQQQQQKNTSSSTTDSLSNNFGSKSGNNVFADFLRSRWENYIFAESTKIDKPLSIAGEKLVWILTLLIIGLEREAAKLATPDFPEDPGQRLPSVDAGQLYGYQEHSAKNYRDSAKSVAKVLHDFVKERLDSVKEPNPQTSGAKAKDNSAGLNPYNNIVRRGRKIIAQSPPPPGVASRKVPGAGNSTAETDKPLLLIGDVLHRTRTFLADPLSPPAALLRGEVIEFLCDVLYLDTKMELSEEEATSSVAGNKSGPINDLGSAGSLLKLMILNCLSMCSPGCEAVSSPTASNNEENNDEQKDDSGELMLRFGSQKETAKMNVHRLHAGNRFLAVVHRLAASTSTSARVTACSLSPILWAHLDFPHQLQLRGVITRALHDVEVVVRISTATVLHEIAELVFDPRAVPWLVLMSERVMNDPEAELRAAAMTLTWHLAEHLPNAFLGDASKGSSLLRRLPPRTDPTFTEVYLLQCKLLPVATRLAEDRAPPVRLAVAAQCDRLCNALGEHWFNVIVDLLQALLGDTDERVRSEAILCVPRFLETVMVSSSSDTISMNLLESLLPVTAKMIRDSSPTVRISLATSAGELITLLVGLDGAEDTLMQSPGAGGANIAEASSAHRRHKKYVDDSLIPLVQKLLYDSDPEVTSSALRAVTNASRGNVREIRPRKNSTMSEDDTVSLSSYQSENKEPVFIPVLSEKQVLRLLPTLSDLAHSRQWRVRQGAVEIVPALLGCTHRLETRSEIAQLCVRLMNDRVDAVRRTAAECLCLGGGSLGCQGEGSKEEWINAIVLPCLRACSESMDSKQRMLSLKMVEAVLLSKTPITPGEHASFHPNEGRAGASPFRELIEIAVSLSGDRIVNVRLNFGRVMCNVIHAISGEEISIVAKALLQQISEEKKKGRGGDRDVLYFAEKGLTRIQMRLEEIGLNPKLDKNR